MNMYRKLTVGQRLWTVLVPAILLVMTVPAFLAAAPITPQEYQRLVGAARIVQANIAELESHIKVSTALVRYEKEFKAAVPRDASKRVTMAALGETLKKARLVVMGDDHTTSESQTNTVEVLQFMKAGPGPLVLVIEWIDVSRQKEVDRFLTGGTTLTELRQSVQFDKDWGFSWKSYSRILAAAKKFKVPVLLTERLKSKPSLAQRDTMIAADVAAYGKAHPGTRFLIVYGEFHVLGPDHLAEKLAKASMKPDVKIIGEAEHVYWKLLQQTLNPSEVKGANLGGGIFYLRGGSPLERMLANRQYLMKLVGYSADDFEDWVSDRDAAPVLKSTERFEQLHQPTR
jgi:hypothetical protein